MNRNIRHESRTLAAAFAALLVTLILGGHAMAAPIVVLNDGEHQDLIISRGQHRIHIFQDTLEIDPWPTPGGDAPYSLILNFQFTFGDPDLVSGVIAGNMLPLFPARPLQTPAIAATGGLRLENETIDATRSYVLPSYEPFSGETLPAFIGHGTSPFSAFDLTSFESGEMAYIGLANSSLSMFGYMQIERVNVLDWKLIGYAYDPTGAPVVVERLVVPVPPSLFALGGAAAAIAMRRKVR
jgi:hypothetical protein